MLTLNTILEEIKDVPENRLEDLHLFIKSLIPNRKIKDNSEIELEIKEAEKEFNEGRFTKIENEKQLEAFFESL